MSRLTYRLTLIPDCYYVAQRMRSADRDEVASCGRTPIRCLLNGYIYGHKCITILIDGIPIAICGTVISNAKEPKAASIWLLGTDGITEHKRLFIENSKAYLDYLCEGYDLVWNYVDARNRVHIRWLRWLGFVFIRSTTDKSIDGTSFYEFAKITNV